MSSLHYISEFVEQNFTNSTCVILLSAFVDIMPRENNRFGCGSVITLSSSNLPQMFSVQTNVFLIVFMVVILATNVLVCIIIVTTINFHLTF